MTFTEERKDIYTDILHNKYCRINVAVSAFSEQKREFRSEGQKSAVKRPLSSCPIMDDPLLAQANNTELIRDVSAIMFHGDAMRACLLLQTFEKLNFLSNFFATGCPTSVCQYASVIECGDRPIR